MYIATINFTISYLITGTILLALAFFVYSRDRHNALNLTFALYSLSIGWWGIFSIFMINSPSVPVATIWDKVCLIGTVFIPSTFTHFIFTFLNYDKKHENIVKINYLISLFFLWTIFTTDLFVVTTEPKDYIQYFTRPGFLYSTFVVYFVIISFTGIYLLFAAMKKESVDIFKKQQLMYLFWTSLFGYAGGTFNYMLVYNLTNSNWAALGNYLIAIYGFAVAYIILRYRFLDIEVLVKKTLVFAGLFSSIFVVTSSLILIAQQLLQRLFNRVVRFDMWVSLGVSILLMMVLYDKLKTSLINVTNRYLFQKKYDYKHLIRDFMDELKTMVLNADDIAQSTIDFLNSSIRPVSSAIFMYNKFTGRYDLIASSDFKDKSFKIPDTLRFIKVLGETGKIMNMRGDDNLLLPEEKKQWSVLEIELIIPLLIHKELIGLLCLGKKKSDEDYGEEDIGALSDLSGALSISLNNAQLFDERADAEKRALVGTIATGINHEIGNPLNIITIKLDTFRILAKEGLLAHKTKEQIIEDVDKITKVCLDSAQRIAEITKQVAEFAKPDKKLMFDKANINEVIDETIAFLKHGMIVEPEKIEKKIACEPVYVLADRGQLKQILFNLVKNASHAIDKESGKIAISVDKNSNGEVIIKVIDNGRGISKTHMDRVFTPFFTTKEPGKGTGLGLALVKIMIDRNGARIKVESEEGKGTTFTLIFKGGLL